MRPIPISFDSASYPIRLNTQSVGKGLTIARPFNGGELASVRVVENQNEGKVYLSKTQSTAGTQWVR